MRIGANLTLLFTEYPEADRPAAAARAGFDAVEILFPYNRPPRTVLKDLTRAGLPLQLINTPEPDWDSGGRGNGAIPGAEDDFRAGFRKALTYARALGAPLIHVLAGRSDDPAALDTFLANLLWASAEAPDKFLTLEPLNPQDHPGYALDSFDKACALLDRAARPNLALQFDIYHAARMGHDPLALLRDLAERTAHIQFSGLPDRGAPKDIADLARFLDETGYPGVAAAEYQPPGNTEDSLAWLSTLKSP
ncbi:hydroxypyruvate isomerase family protein [Poseidonocella sedimentorum]|uniref:Hydroxypyruvate isomerase n=1 Tax=Poseidonocella sedimentorum TaxID=871652 RepID=A0A1I6ECB6_9RHOB|nr:TIM barrel protein [Poseidonocella sedimentorum]SFR15162.1 hydroxypyruvate isomerase [Poseidonocella sedimentorum]